MGKELLTLIINIFIRFCIIILIVMIPIGVAQSAGDHTPSGIGTGEGDIYALLFTNYPVISGNFLITEHTDGSGYIWHGSSKGLSSTPISEINVSSVKRYPSSGVAPGYIAYTQSGDEVIHQSSNNYNSEINYHPAVAIGIKGQTIDEDFKTPTFTVERNDNENTIDITDDEKSSVVINEFLADPDGAGDANGDGAIGDDDEFIEIVNNSSNAIDISGWQLSDNGGATIRYTFSSGTVLQAHQAVVVFGGGNPVGGFGGALIQTASGLSLNDSRDNPTLLDNTGSIIQTVSYGGSGEPSGTNQSITRDPDITGKFVDHTDAINSGESHFSPGTRVDGTTFDPAISYATGFHRDEGWRFIASPTQNTSFIDLLSNLRIHGASRSASREINVFDWRKAAGGSFSPVTSMARNMEPGEGYLIYVYEDDDYHTPGVQGGFPKILKSTNAENSSPVTVTVSSKDDDNSGRIDNNEGYNLLGNPYGVDILASEVINALEKVDQNVNANILVWDHSAGGGNGSFVSLDGSEGSSDVIAPFQAFFVRYMTDGVSGNISLNRNDLAASRRSDFYKEPNKSENILTFTLGNGSTYDTYKMEFKENGSINQDRLDVHKLFSLNTNSINLFSTVNGGARMSKNVLPPMKSLEGELRVPLGYEVPTSGEYTLKWDVEEIESIPNQYVIYLVDREQDRRINLRTSEELSFNARAVNNDRNVKDKVLPKLSSKDNSKRSRFELLITLANKNEESSEALKKPVSISPNYPNPFRTQTTMDLNLEEKMHVKITIWNIVGQKIETLRDEMMETGEPITWNVTSNLPSGIYICKVEAGGSVLTRKMTLIK